ncbi:phosphotransferase enzyme family protein [Deinococcus altitudinis]|uniref:phosphotransferase enzyme family protein n=1 Tax=Deinococcus altitudinis TaxID=468914 RepID=UPI0038923CC0
MFILRALGDAVARIEMPPGLHGPGVNCSSEVDCNSGVNYSLRVNLPGSRERQQEIHRFLALAAAGLPVPTPLPDLQGRSVSPLADGRTAVLASWVEGEQASRQMSPALAAEIGRVTARLHALRWAPTDWHGPRLDANWLRGWWRDQAPAHLAPADVNRCLPVVEAAANWLDGHAQELQVIHADLHFGNLLALAEGEVGILDFGDCALGHPAFELAMTEGEFMDFGDAPALTGAYRDAYSEVSGQSYPLLARKFMTACTATSFLEWVYGSENEDVRAQNLKWIPGLIERLATAGVMTKLHETL